MVLRAANLGFHLKSRLAMLFKSDDMLLNSDVMKPGDKAHL